MRCRSHISVLVTHLHVSVTATVPAMVSAMSTSMVTTHAGHVAIRLQCGATVCVLTRKNDSAHADQSERCHCYKFLQATSLLRKFEIPGLFTPSPGASQTFCEGRGAYFSEAFGCHRETRATSLHLESWTTGIA